MQVEARPWLSCNRVCFVVSTDPTRILNTRTTTKATSSPTRPKNSASASERISSGDSSSEDEDEKKEVTADTNEVAIETNWSHVRNQRGMWFWAAIHNIDCKQSFRCIVMVLFITKREGHACWLLNWFFTNENQVWMPGTQWRLSVQPYFTQWLWPSLIYWFNPEFIASVLKSLLSWYPYPE